RARRDEPLRTWGGRRYHVEPAKKIKGRLMTFEYKMLNQLIQGSAADCTKEAVIQYEDRREEGRLLLTVHDEMMALAPADRRDREMARLREAMEAVEFDVAMLSEGKVGEVWARLEDYDDEREVA
ncbi:MAG TPA: DNA polymerase, partial [Gammaproteobacteria bacterium]|nr:DNA polymerase [Gammaproteobacteria bacterium]